MINTNIFNYLIENYNKLSYTHDYILGFTFEGMVYTTITTDEVFPYVLSLDKASRGAGYSLRFRPTNAQKAILLNNATPLMSIEMFREIVRNTKGNRGEVYEKIITNNAGLEWAKDNTPFTEAGDVDINGKAYQVKFEGGTFTNEKTIQNRLALKQEEV